MANIIDKWTKKCSCCGCKASFAKWSCGCLTVKIIDEAKFGSCSDCDNFSSKKRYCGKPGWPGH